MFVGLDHRRDRDHRRPHLLPCRLPRPDRRAAEPRKVLLMTTSDRPTPTTRRHAAHRVAPTWPTAWPRRGASSTARSCVGAGRRPSRSSTRGSRSRTRSCSSCWSGTVVTFIEAIAHPGMFAWSITIWLFLTVIFANFAEAMAEGRGKAQADTLRKMRSETEARRLRPDGTEERVAAADVGQGRPGGLRGRRRHPLRRRDHRRRRLGRRIGHHRRVGPGHPRVGRRPLGGDRRHQGAVGPHRRRASPPSAGQTFLDRMITLVEGANRQRTPNEIALTILLAVLTIVFLPVVVTLQPFGALRRGHGVGRRPGGAARLPDPHHHRRPAVGHRHRRDGPPRPAQRAGHERPGGGGGRRRADPAARQDRHHHSRQPDGLGLLPGRRAQRARSWPTPPSWPRWPTRRPRAAPSWCWPRSASTSASASSTGEHELRPVLGHDPDVGPRHRRPPDPQGRGRVGSAVGRRAGWDRPRRARRDRRADLPGRARRRWWWPTARRSSGSSS